MSPPTRAANNRPHTIKVVYACSCLRCGAKILPGQAALRDPTRATASGGVAFYCSRCGPERLQEADVRPVHQARLGDGGSQRGMF